MNRSDLGNAQRMILRSGDIIRYCEELRCWLIWDGTRWRFDKTLEIFKIAKQVPMEIHREASVEEDKDRREKLGKHALSTESTYRLKMLVESARSEQEIQIVPNDLDNDKYKLNVLNGTIELTNGVFREHKKEDLITKIAPRSALYCPLHRLP